MKKGTLFAFLVTISVGAITTFSAAPDDSFVSALAVFIYIVSTMLLSASYGNLISRIETIENKHDALCHAVLDIDPLEKKPDFLSKNFNLNIETEEDEA